MEVSVPVWQCSRNKKHKVSFGDGDEDLWPGFQSRLNVRSFADMLWRSGDGLSIPSLTKLARELDIQPDSLRPFKIAS